MKSPALSKPMGRPAVTSALLVLTSFTLSAQEKSTAVPWSTDFSKHETKVPWVVSPEDIAALAAKTPNRNWDEAKVGSYTLPETMPLVNAPFVNGPIAYHLITGEHALTLYGWKLYLDHADTLFKNTAK